MTRIAIIGAGFTGLCLAHLLQSRAPGVELTVFEKARGPGGRMSTRRIDEWHFDHGTQFFTAHHPAFQNFLAPYLDAGLVQPWQPKLLGLTRDGTPYRRAWFEPHYVAVPTMTSLAQSLAASLAVVLQHEVKRMQRHGKEWVLQFVDGQMSEPFDWVIVTLPAPMACALLPADFRGYEPLRQVRYSPGATLMLGFREELPLSWDAATVDNATLSWVVRGSSRPGHPGPDTLLLQSNFAWAQAHMDASLTEATTALEAALRALPGLADLPEAACRYLHRWRYAWLQRLADSPAYLDPSLHLAACGEWGLGSNVESCYLSALMMAEQLEALTSPSHAVPQHAASAHLDTHVAGRANSKTRDRQH